MRKKIVGSKLRRVLAIALVFALVTTSAMSAFATERDAQTETTPTAVGQSDVAQAGEEVGESTDAPANETVPTESTAAPAAAQTETVTTLATEGGLTYEIKGDEGEYGAGAYVTSVDGGATNVVVPATLGGADVVYIHTSYYGLASLDVSNCTKLKFLNCNGRFPGSSTNFHTEITCLTSLDVSKNTALTYLDCGGNKITSLDVSKNTALTDLNCSNNCLPDSENRRALITRFSESAILPQYNVESGIIYEVRIDEPVFYEPGAYVVGYTGVSQDVVIPAMLGGQPVVEVNIKSDILTSLDVSACTNLKYLDCGDNNLSSLDVSKNIALEHLDCENNNLIALDVSKNSKLVWLSCYNNRLTSLDVSNNLDLYGLICDGNRLTSLDVSKNEISEMWFFCYNNYIPDSAERRALIERFGEDAVLPQYAGLPPQDGQTPTNPGDNDNTPAVEIISDGGAKYTLGSGKNFVVKSPRSMSGEAFTNLLVDGNALALEHKSATLWENAYAKVEEGSTVATLYPSYLDTLSVGEHTVTLAYADGNNATVTFEVAKSGSPKTGDETPLLALVLLLVIAVAGSAALFMRRRHLLWKAR
ncbi:MAG: hypothetical protein LBQ21_00990 [Clostridiales Family XIII bacterium]|jgi:hypothetical protein|nr:hypothetical protein [Clostridiales Family XIII bacterium]